MHSVMKKFLPPSWFLSFLHIWQIQMFKIIKQILTLDKDNPSKYEMLFLNEGGKAIQTCLDLCEKSNYLIIH